MPARLVANRSYPTVIRFGAARIAELPDACGSLWLARPPPVTDPSLATLELVRSAAALSGRLGA